MIQTISLVEPLKHYEVLSSILRLLEGKKILIQIFTTKFCQDHLEFVDSNITVFAEDTPCLTDNFLHTHFDEINNSDVVIFTTIDMKSSFLFHIGKNTKIMGLVHNSNNFFLSDRAPRRNLLKYQVYKYLGTYRKNNQILEKLDKVLVPDLNIAKNIWEKNVGLETKVQAIDIAVPKFQSTINNHDVVQIIVPGTVNQDRRDYKQLFGILPAIDSRLSKSVCITLLGRIYSQKEKDLILEFYRQKFEHITLEYFDKYVEPSEYTSRMRKADFLLLPIQRYISYKSIQEERGKTCVSGNINDMVQFCCPAILPQFYPLNSDLTQLVSTYSNQKSMIELIVTWVNRAVYQKLKNEIHLDQYKENVTQKLISVLGI